jgi:hypothetical protein
MFRQIETTGAERTEEIVDLEVLFLTFDEVSSLHCCPNLRRLALIDNGLRRISNLSPVSISLQILCLCDQSIELMENLNLPNLKELYLHRNQIRKIDGLEGCPRLKKLWLFQNQITDISGLEAVPDLEELWLQANEIRSLSGIEMNPNLTNLGLAGNRIQDLREVRKLIALARLKEVSFTDIHFGRCPIADEEGYKEYFTLQLRQVRILDGVQMRGDAVATAEDIYFREMTAFHESLQTIEEVYQKNLRAIELQHQSRESYSQVLEKEMSVALKELQSLVDEGRKIVKKEIDHSNHLVESNLTSLQSALQVTEKSTEQALAQHTQHLADEYWHSMNLVHLLEMVEWNHTNLMQMLTEVQQSTAATNSMSASTGRQSSLAQESFAYQYLGNNTADFVLIATLLDSSRMLYQSQTAPNNSYNNISNNSDLQVTDVESTKNTPRNRRVPSTSATNNKANGSANTDHDVTTSTTVSGSNSNNVVTKPLELARLYRVVRITPNSSANSKFIQYRRVFTIVSLDMLKSIFSTGWSGMSQSVIGNSRARTLLFSEDAELLTLLYEPHESMQQLQVPVSQDVLAIQHRADEDIRRLLKASLADSASSGDEETKWNPLGKAVVLLSCHAACDQDDSLAMMATASAVGASASPATNMVPITIPPQSSHRAMLLEELHTSSKARTLLVRNRPCNVPNGQSVPVAAGDADAAVSKIYTLPVAALTALPASALIAEFIALAICHQQITSASVTEDDLSPIHADARSAKRSSSKAPSAETAQPLLKNLEGRLELLLLPTRHVEDASRLLSSYEQESQVLLKRYVDQLMEGVDANQAAVWRQAEEEMLQQEQALKQVREDIEKERRSQEAALRDLKVQVGAESSGNSTTANTMQSSGSAKQLRSRRSS